MQTNFSSFITKLFKFVINIVKVRYHPRLSKLVKLPRMKRVASTLPSWLCRSCGECWPTSPSPSPACGSCGAPLAPLCPCSVARGSVESPAGKTLPRIELLPNLQCNTELTFYVICCFGVSYTQTFTLFCRIEESATGDLKGTEQRLTIGLFQI